MEAVRRGQVGQEEMGRRSVGLNVATQSWLWALSGAAGNHQDR